MDDPMQINVRFRNGIPVVCLIRSKRTIYVCTLCLNGKFDGFSWVGVLLCSIAEAFIMQIEAKDDDEVGTINSEIYYSIISQEPAGTGDMFRIDRKTGKLYVKEATLDREVRSIEATTHVLQPFWANQLTN